MPPSPDAAPLSPRTPSYSSTKADSAHASFSTDSDGNTVAPPHPFLAYGRRVRSFSSTLKLNKARYLLTFVDNETAQEWWELMKKEYPDSIRESPQLFSFKSDKVPGRAWENPRFAHLRDKWTYRQLEEGEKDGPTGGKEKKGFLGRRPTLAKAPSMPTLRTIGEGTIDTPAKGTEVEDPFATKEDVVPNSVPRTMQFTGLSNVLDRIQSMMETTQTQISALAREQRDSAERLQRLQNTVEQNASQVKALMDQQQAGVLSTERMKSSIEQNTTHIRSLMERTDASSEETSSLQALVEETSTHVRTLAGNQAAHAQDTSSAISALAAQMSQLADHQHATNARAEQLANTLAQNTSHITTLLERPSPQPQPSQGIASAGGVAKLQSAIEANSTHLKTLIEGQKSSTKQFSKLHAALTTPSPPTEGKTERQKPAPDWEQVVKATREQQMQVAERLKEGQEALVERMERAMQQQAAQMREEREGFLRAVEALVAKGAAGECRHDVLPPPRKVNRKLVGYVYSRD
ncbi:hypothetical protein H2203_002233 [Taxawa tesnikishii (nom. ined.)]|nr:hypothetical protein H2203_002233 [Dothideales sp. JES 119]